MVQVAILPPNTGPMHGTLLVQVPAPGTSPGTGQKYWSKQAKTQIPSAMPGAACYVGRPPHPPAFRGIQNMTISRISCTEERLATTQLKIMCRSMQMFFRKLTYGHLVTTTASLHACWTPWPVFQDGSDITVLSFAEKLPSTLHSKRKACKS